MNTTQNNALKLSKSTPSETVPPISNFEMIATGVVTGIIATGIMQTGRGVVSLLAKNPVVIFGAGFATGYFLRKYRKGIILSANKVTEQSKDFALRQKKHLDDLLTCEND